MKVLVTGATGYIGSRVVDQLLAQGHNVIGLCRNEDSAKALRTKGAEPFIGDIKEVEPLEKLAREVDGILHLAFIHDFSNMEGSVEVEKTLLLAFARALKGTNKPLVVTVGTFILGPSKPGEPWDDAIDASFVANSPNPRGRMDAFSLNDLGKKEGINVKVIRVAPFVYGHNGSWFVPSAIRAAKKNGYAAYVGDGSHPVTSAHVDDVAAAYVSVLTKGKAGQGYHAVTGNNITFKELAEAVGKLVGVEAKSITKEEAGAYFGGGLASFGFIIHHHVITSRLPADCGWKPTRPTIIEDVVNGSYKA